MENDLKYIIYDNYKIDIVNISTLTGGWMNKKFLCTDITNNKYVIKLFSTKKVKKMSNGEFSSDYLDNQLLNNLKVENNMYSKNLNCEQIKVDKKNRILLPYSDYRLAVIKFLSGSHILRKDINNIQLYNLGCECAKMHYLFKTVDPTPYTGEYLKMPTIEKLFYRYEIKLKKTTKSDCQLYHELLIKQKEILLLLEKTNIINEIPISMTHGDFTYDNILFEKNIPKILDFELVRLNSPLLDIGRIIMSYCYNNNILNIDKVKYFMQGYNSIIELKDRDIFLSFVTVWINEVDMWIKGNYFNKKITEKSKRFQEELTFLTFKMYDIIQYYMCDKSLGNFNQKRRILK